MWLTLDDLRCTHCSALVHPLLDACPACGAARVSRRGDAAAGPIGAVRLADAPETLTVARNISMRYTMKVNEIGRSVGDATLEDAVGHLADALPYLVSGGATSPADNVALSLVEGYLVARARAAGTLVAEIPLRSIVGTVASHGETTCFYAPGTAPAPGSHLVEPPAAGPLRLVVANRRGMLASKARDDHYASLALWLGVLAAAAAERRWSEVGLPAYLAELGLAPALGLPAAPAEPARERAGAWSGTTGAESPARSPGAAAERPAAARVEPGPGATAAPHSSVQASLVELEGLLGAGLVSEIEYAEKRREILARL